MNINGLDKQHEEEVGSFCAVVRFKVKGDMRYLSHAEMMRLFQRACVRAGVGVAYSQGFNPHQRMSLVLPRSVGVESDDEMIYVRLEEDASGFDVEALTRELPEGIEIISAQVNQTKSIPSPDSVKYLVKTKEDCAVDNNYIEGLLANGEIIVERRTGENSRVKPTDVRPFLKSIIAEKTDIIVECKVSPAGTIRVDEILDLLKLRVEDLTWPVRRVSVQYS